MRMPEQVAGPDKPATLAGDQALDLLFGLEPVLFLAAGRESSCLSLVVSNYGDHLPAVFGADAD